MKFEIAIDDLSDGGVVELLSLHRKEMSKYSPPESIHALDVAALQSTEITFWSARRDGVVVACGALKELSSIAGELKSMKTRTEFLRKGLGRNLLKVILDEAGSRGYRTVSLETGTDSAFNPAVALYEHYGFVECPPFGEYMRDPYSRFYTKRLAGSA
ncbi:GNAT family N-acetyltransferase [Microbulbifer elongatus]|uniref:GNAT family N-acetyltransferase n=1 Tax=Microbulbifer elongatus TaxID=86173 RepID=UPI001CFF14F3|nr:GNAT family N-acetyltransferase [Microbulbifer elongatus]